MPPNTRFSSYIRPGSLLGTLPIDLKREILETTAYLHPPFASRMALVSRDVQPWAERIIYRELFFNGQRVFNHSKSSDTLTSLQKIKIAVSGRPASFFAEYVKSLHFDGTFAAEDILTILRVCTGVTNFGLYATIDGDGVEEVYRLTHALPLETLFISSKNLTSLLQVPLDDADTPKSSLLKLTHLGLIDGWEPPLPRFPALTHLALVPDYENEVLPHVRAALARGRGRMQSVVVMLNYSNIPRQTLTLQALRDIVATDPRLILFTLPVSPTRYIEDDLWDLAKEFPDEEQPVAYLDEIPGPRILSFQELMALGL